jgi:hypothetical protein
MPGVWGTELGQPGCGLLCPICPTRHVRSLLASAWEAQRHEGILHTVQE